MTFRPYPGSTATDEDLSSAETNHQHVPGWREECQRAEAPRTDHDFRESVALSALFCTRCGVLRPLDS